MKLTKEHFAPFLNAIGVGFALSFGFFHIVLLKGGRGSGEVTSLMVDTVCLNAKGLSVAFYILVAIVSAVFFFVARTKKDT